MDTLRTDFLDLSRQALAQSGDPDGQGLSAIQQVEQADDNSWFDTATNALAQLPVGFWEGFTTLRVDGSQPQSKAAEVMRGIGHLLGFIGFIPDPGDLLAAPTKAALLYGGKKVSEAAAKRITAKAVKRGLLDDAARALLLTDSAKLIRKAEDVAGMNGYGQLLQGVLAGKSVPMLAAKGAQAGVGKLLGVPLVAKGAQSATALLKGSKAFGSAEKLGILSDMGLQAFHLGVASGVSGLGINPAQWGDRVDDAIGGLASGAVMGGAFGLIGNIGRVSTKLILDGKQSSAEYLLRTMAGAAVSGLPSTLQGRDAVDQVYDYLLGGYFGFHATPWVVNQGRGQAAEAFKQNQDVAKTYLDAKDYGRFAQATGVTTLRTWSPQASDIMMRESLKLHGLPEADVAKIMRNPKKYEPLEPAKEVRPVDVGKAAYDVEEQVRMTREAWDAQYKDVVASSADWRSGWKEIGEQMVLPQEPAEMSAKDWRKIKEGKHLYQGPITIDMGSPQEQRRVKYVLAAQERARLTNRSLISSVED